MCPNNGAIDKVHVPAELSGLVGLLAQCLEHPAPHSGLAPEIKTAPDGLPRAVALGQVPPGRPCALDPQQAIEQLAVIAIRTACSWFLRRGAPAAARPPSLLRLPPSCPN